MEITKS